METDGLREFQLLYLKHFVSLQFLGQNLLVLLDVHLYLQKHLFVVDDLKVVEAGDEFVLIDELLEMVADVVIRGVRLLELPCLLDVHLKQFLDVDALRYGQVDVDLVAGEAHQHEDKLQHFNFFGNLRIDHALQLKDGVENFNHLVYFLVQLFEILLAVVVLPPFL